MVRGPAAVLILLAAAQAYVLAAPALPVLADEDVSVFVAASLGAAAALVWAAAVVPLSDTPGLAALAALGGLLVMAGLNVADVGAAATPVEAAAYAAAGAVFAVGLLTPSLAVALPVVVAGIDVASTTMGGPSELLARGTTELGDPLSLAFADWGTGLPAGRLGISDAVFAGVFLVYARRYGLRFAATAVGLWLAVVAAVGLKLWLDVAIPALPLLAAAYFLVNLDRLPGLFRRAASG